MIPLNRLIPALLLALGMLSGPDASPQEPKEKPGSWKQVRVIESSKKEPLAAVAPMKDGSFLAAHRGENTYERFDAKTGKKLEEFAIEPKAMEPGLKAVPNENHTLALTPDEKFLLSANTMGNTVAILDLKARRTVATVEIKYSPYAFQNVTDKSCRVVCQGTVAELTYSNARVGKPAEYDQWVMSSDGKTGYALRAPQGQGGQMTLLLTPKEAKVPLGKVDRYDGCALSLSSDGKRLYVLVSGHRVMVIDTDAKKVADIAGLPLAPVILNMTLSPDGSTLVLWAPEKGSISSEKSASNPEMQISKFIQAKGQLFILDAASLKPLDLDTSDIKAPKEVCFSPDGKYLLVPNETNKVVVFEK